MSRAITITKEGGYVRVHVAGDLTLEGGKQVAAAALNAAAEHHCMKVLVDVRDAALKLSIVDLFSLGEFASGIVPVNAMKISLLTRQEDLQPDRFFEQVVRNRGVQMTVFTDDAEAVTWLESR